MNLEFETNEQKTVSENEHIANSDEDYANKMDETTNNSNKLRMMYLSTKCTSRPLKSFNGLGQLITTDTVHMLHVQMRNI